MGVNTEFELEINDRVNRDEVARKLYDILLSDVDQGRSDYENIVRYAREHVDELTYRGSYYGRWYSYFEDMKRLSSQFPNVWFRLYGMADGASQRWEAYFYNGKGSQVSQDDFIDWLIGQCGSNQTRKQVYDRYIISQLK